MSAVRHFLLILLLALAPASALSSAVHAQTPPPVTAADRVLGHADAPVTVVEYASFVCPHCAHWQATVFPDFKTRFIDTGRVKLVFRDLPTEPQNVATAAAMIGRCAAPGQFFAVATAFFAGQPALIASRETRPWFDSAIAQSGQTKEQIQACFANPATGAGLTADVTAAVSAGINSTPAFFVNGRPLAGDPTIEGLATAIAAAKPGP
jgi:protein-disulfide isomerase